MEVWRSPKNMALFSPSLRFLPRDACPSCLPFFIIHYYETIQRHFPERQSGRISWHRGIRTQYSLRWGLDKEGQCVCDTNVIIRVVWSFFLENKIKMNLLFLIGQKKEENDLSPTTANDKPDFVIAFNGESEIGLYTERNFPSFHVPPCGKLFWSRF